MEPASSLFGADAFLSASRALVSVALLAASTMRALMAGKSTERGGDYQGWVRARKVEAGLQIVILPPAPRFGPRSLGAKRAKPTTEVAGVVEQVGVHGRGDASRAGAGGDEGGHGWQSHDLSRV